MEKTPRMAVVIGESILRVVSEKYRLVVVVVVVVQVEELDKG